MAADIPSGNTEATAGHVLVWWVFMLWVLLFIYLFIFIYFYQNTQLPSGQEQEAVAQVMEEGKPLVAWPLSSPAKGSYAQPAQLKERR